jgi:hypothetical protein
MVPFYTAVELNTHVACLLPPSLLLLLLHGVQVKLLPCDEGFDPEAYLAIFREASSSSACLTCILLCGALFLVALLPIFCHAKRISNPEAYLVIFT